MTDKLSRAFYARPALEVAPELLGKVLVLDEGGARRAGRIAEVEAYVGEHDLACHASKGRTPRTDVLFGPPARAYVFLIYGIHHGFNVVTDEDGVALGVPGARARAGRGDLPPRPHRRAGEALPGDGDHARAQPARPHRRHDLPRGRPAARPPQDRPRAADWRRLRRPLGAQAVPVLGARKPLRQQGVNRGAALASASPVVPASRAHAGGPPARDVGFRAARPRAAGRSRRVRGADGAPPRPGSTRSLCG